jgi:hypothetical protein
MIITGIYIKVDLLSLLIELNHFLLSLIRLVLLFKSHKPLILTQIPSDMVEQKIYLYSAR